MNKSILTMLFLAMKAVKGARGPKAYHRSFMDLARLKMSLMYVKSIETFRQLFISVLGVGISLVFVLSGLVLLHVALFVYTPWTAQTKMLLAFGLAAVYLFIAYKAFAYVYSEAQWLKIFHADEVLEDAGRLSPEPASGPYYAKDSKRTYKESGPHN